MAVKSCLNTLTYYDTIGWIVTVNCQHVQYKTPDKMGRNFNVWYSFHYQDTLKITYWSIIKIKVIPTSKHYLNPPDDHLTYPALNCWIISDLSPVNKLVCRITKCPASYCKKQPCLFRIPINSNTTSTKQHDTTRPYPALVTMYYSTSIKQRNVVCTYVF